MAEVATKKSINVSESREETVTTSSTVVTSSKGGTKTKKKKIEGVAGNDASSPNLTPRTKKTKKSKKSDLEKENISVKSSFNKFDALTKKTVLHVRSIDAAKVQQQLNAVGQNSEANTNCRSCGKVVFQMEQTKAEGLVWHKNCFRCVQCSKQLNVDNYESHESTLYCKPHFKELFQPKPVEESDQPVRPRKPELIIRENEPKELPPDVVRASDKPDLGLEELSSLNVKSRFQVFEKASTENSNEIERSPSQIAVKRSPSILSKLAKFQAKGMDIGVADESLNGIPYEESSESEDEVETEENEEVETEIVKSKRTTRERPISFSKMDDIKNRWESTSQQGRREIQREARKEEIAGIRSRLFMGKQGKMKEMYQQAVAGSDRVTKINAAEEIQHSAAHARSIKERFERGEPIAVSDDETDSKPKPEKADEEVIAAGISRKSRSLFLELDATAAKTGRPVTPVHPKTPTLGHRQFASSAFPSGFKSTLKCIQCVTCFVVHVGAADEHSSIIAPISQRVRNKAFITMEVLMHEASNRQENGVAGAPICTIDLRSASKESQENVDDASSHVTHDSVKKSIDIIFENITYTVSLGFRKGQKEILHGINGRLPSKQLIALMGPSGAGKSTLLDVLSGFRVTGVNGVVYINGRVRHLNSFRKCSAYITQDDRLEYLLTVLENMRVAADLKLPSNTSKCKKEMIIENILTTLGLYEHVYTKTGRLSGGQKKRLSIALELVNNPTVMFLDEPTTGLDSSSCMQVVNLLKLLAQQGRTIVCTIHQPSASLFQLFDQVYVLSKGDCLYQGATNKLLPYLESIKMPCPMYHNPADYIIELACGEYGEDKVDVLINASQNGRNLKWFDNQDALRDAKSLRAAHPITEANRMTISGALHATNLFHQIQVLLRRGYIMCKRDTTLTHLRIGVNVIVGLMLGAVFLHSGRDGSRVLDNYNLLFSILIHHMMTTMMLTIVTFPMQMSILLKEHFNRWYTLKAFYTAITLIDLPISIVCCTLFSLIIYFMSGQPMEIVRFSMFLTITLLIIFIAQGMGLMIGAVFNVVNGTFMGPTLTVPIMMFAGFGVSLRDLPQYLKWGTYLSYLKYGLEGYVGAIYGLDRPTLDCNEKHELYCHYKYPSKFLSDIAMRGDQFWNDVIALIVILIVTRLCAYLLLRWKIASCR